MEYSAFRISADLLKKLKVLAGERSVAQYLRDIVEADRQISLPEILRKLDENSKNSELAMDALVATLNKFIPGFAGEFTSKVEEKKKAEKESDAVMAQIAADVGDSFFERKDGEPLIKGYDKGPDGKYQEVKSDSLINPGPVDEAARNKIRAERNKQRKQNEKEWLESLTKEQRKNLKGK